MSAARSGRPSGNARENRHEAGEAAPTAALARSNPFGITCVVTLSRGNVRQLAPGVSYLHFPVAEGRPSADRRLDGIIDALYQEIRWGKVLVHIFEGVNRAPILAAAWVHVVGCKSIHAALPEIEKLRPIEPNPKLLRSVKESL
jgi:protein-tyrosine phosphatase